MFPTNGIIAFFNPIGGGDNSWAGAGLAGQICGFDDMINSKGLYAEFNNGAGTIGSTLYSNRICLFTYLTECLVNFDTIEELRLAMNSSKAGYPAIVGTCEPKRGQFFEVNIDGTYAMPEPEQNQLTCRANQYLDPMWGIPDLPSPAIWYSRNRRESFTSLIMNKPAGTVDEKAFMEVMNTHLLDKDGKELTPGLSVFETAKKGVECTIIQVITHSASLTWWVRVPTKSSWHKIELGKYFTNK